MRVAGLAGAVGVTVAGLAAVVVLQARAAARSWGVLAQLGAAQAAAIRDHVAISAYLHGRTEDYVPEILRD